MMVSQSRGRRLVLLAVIFASALVWFLSPVSRVRPTPSLNLESTHPTIWHHIHVKTEGSTGGAWYIPPAWLPAHSDNPPRTILEAAELVLNATRLPTDNVLPQTVIPRVIHQTWKDTNAAAWPDVLRDSVEKWISAAVADEMAYFLWDDEGVASLVAHFEPDLSERYFQTLPLNVERSDVFRILVCKWIGGVYGDIDTEPLQSPVNWITSADLAPWTDPETGHVYDSAEPPAAIYGIEADCPTDSDAYWRMGYEYPVQLTQWALASAPQHPILRQYLSSLQERLSRVEENHEESLTSPAAQAELRRIDPLILTGPSAVTAAAQSWLEIAGGLRWNALSGLTDGGRSKLVQDVVILPITGFSPGRGKYGNMGSKPITDPSARLRHRAQGSWRSFDWKVEMGKLCRTVLGRCRDWPKTPGS